MENIIKLASESGMLKFGVTLAWGWLIAQAIILIIAIILVIIIFKNIFSSFN